MTIRRVTQGGSAPQAPEVARLNLSRNNRFLVAIGGLAILYLLFTGVGYVMTASERLAIERDAATAIELRAMTDVLRDAVGDQEATIDLYLLSRDPAAIALYEEAVTAETGAESALRTAASGAPAVLVAVDDLAAFSASWRSTFAKPAMNAARSGGPILELFTGVTSGNHEAIDAAGELLAERIAEVDLALRRRGDDLEAARTAATIVSLAVMLLGSGGALLLIRRFGQVLERDAMHAGILNRFTEVTSFAVDDSAIAASNLEALALLVHPDASVTHVLKSIE